MKISRKAWDSFIKRLGRLDEAAAGKVVAYMEGRDYTTKEGRKNLLDYAYAIATRYGEGAAEVACQMYDAVAAASGKKLPTAEPAKTATYGEVARAVNGALLLSQEAKTVGAAVGRTVRQAGADTTAQNAVRDGAEWAWIPSGDSCSYCLMLASQGWVKASAKVLKGNHAQHIHNNCDCTFAIRHDGRSTVEGYDPDALREQWDAADGRTWQEKLRYLDRKKYAANREAIRARKKVEYAARNGQKNVANSGDSDIIKPSEVVSGHDGTPKKAEPGAVVDHIGKDGKTETRAFYYENGMKKKDITNHNHGKPKQHPYGDHGEHAHDYEWNDDGTLRNRTTREITDKERKENGDIL